jgi:hypothetical protein
VLLERAEAGLPNGYEIIPCGDCCKMKGSVVIRPDALRKIGCGGCKSDLRSGNGPMLGVVYDAFDLAKNIGMGALAKKQTGEKKEQYSSAHKAEDSFM